MCSIVVLYFIQAVSRVDIEDHRPRYNLDVLVHLPNHFLLGIVIEEVGRFALMPIDIKRIGCGEQFFVEADEATALGAHHHGDEVALCWMHYLLHPLWYLEGEVHLIRVSFAT